MSLLASPARQSPMSQMIAKCDWACVHGDLDALAHHAALLSLCVAEPLGRELREVARRCAEDAVFAPVRWYEVRDRLRAQLRTVDPALHPSA
jgi:hypothetical protein